MKKSKSDELLCRSLIQYRMLSSYLSHDCLGEFGRVSTLIQVIEHNHRDVLAQNDEVARIVEKVSKNCRSFIHHVEDLYSETKCEIPFLWIASKSKEWKKMPNFFLQHETMVQVFKNPESLFEYSKRFRPTVLIIEETFDSDLINLLQRLGAGLFKIVVVGTHEISSQDSRSLGLKTFIRKAKFPPTKANIAYGVSLAKRSN